MKNRKIVLVAFLLLSAVILSVGYAAISHTLKVENYINLNYDKKNFVVNFLEDGTTITKVITDGETKTGAALTEYLGDGATTVTAARNTSNTSVATITVKAGVLKKIGDQIVVECVVVNESENYGAVIKNAGITTSAGLTTVPVTQPTDEDNINTYVGVSCTLQSGEQVELTKKTNSDNTDETTVVVTITLKQLPVQAMEGTFTVSILAEATTPES